MVVGGSSVQYVCFQVELERWGRGTNLEVLECGWGCLSIDLSFVLVSLNL